MYSKSSTTNRGLDSSLSISALSSMVILSFISSPFIKSSKLVWSSIEYFFLKYLMNCRRRYSPVLPVLFAILLTHAIAL